LLKIAGLGACGIEMKSFFRSYFSLCTVNGPQLKPHRLKPDEITKSASRRSE